jgi:Ca2+-binding RTX toxin-like protein
MTTVVAYQAINISHIAELGRLANTGPGNVNHQTSTGFIFTQGELGPNSVLTDFIFKGSAFTYYSGFPIHGTITALTIEVNNANAYAFSNFSMSVETAFSYFKSSDPFSALTHVLGGADNITGSNFADVLSGFAGNDVINARAGNDFVRGGAGLDTLDGGANVDTVDYADKTVAVSLTLNGATLTSVKVGSVFEDKIKNFENANGGSANDTLIGDSNANVLNGNAGNDTFSGAAGNDVLLGGIGNDLLNGGFGLDNLIGGPGIDRLVGGADADMDKFVFNAALSNSTNIDTVVDFTVGVDKIVLENAIFTKLTTTGALSPGSFVVGGPHDANDFIAYNSSNGGLYYAANGDAGPLVRFATLATGLNLHSTDFIVA